MKKIFTLAAAVLASFSLWAEEVTMDLALAKGSTPTPSIGEALMNGGAFDGNAYKLGSDGNYIGWNISASEQTFSAVSFNGYINTTNTEKNWGFKFSTDGGATWGEELLQANDGTKEYHNITVSVAIPEGANALQIIRKAGTSCYVSSITLTVGGATPPVPATKPCTTVTIEGPKNAFVGDEVTFKATGFDATPDVINWYDGDFNLVSETNTYKFTPTAAGDYIIQVTAWNAFNTEGEDEAFAYTTLKVSDPADVCGELIKAVHKNKNTADVSGILGGTADKNTQDNGKLGSNGHYFGVKLAQGKFQAGDEVTILASALNGGNTATIYSDKGTTLLGSVDFDTESLTATYTLEEETEWVYLYRAESTCNPSVESITVTRSCEASDNNAIKSLTINGEAVEAVEGVYSYTVGASVNLAAAQVVYSLAHPKATATPASGFMVDVPKAGDPANTQVITVTAQNGDKATYTVSVTKSAELSKDASLKALSVDGYTLDPEFAADVYAYTITKAYGAENPAVSAVHATANDANAQTPVVALNENVFTITVTAEDGETKLNYTISIVEAAAKKDLLEATFSNGVHGYIANGEIKVPYLASEAEPTFDSVRFWKADGEPTAEMVEGKLVVTGIDNKKDEYTITYVALTPMEATYDEITFTEVPSYIYSVYGWDADKGVKFSKDVEEASNHRISEGKDRIYIALPVAQSVILTGGNAGERSVTISVNGVVSDITKTPKKGETITIPLVATEGANLVAIESNGNNGDAGFIKIQLVEGIPTALENVDASKKAVKVIQNGQLLIKKGNMLYNAQGAVVQ